MGASNISIRFPSDFSKNQIEKALEKEREENASENGHASGYSGDWQTIPAVEFHEDKEFSTQNEASDYCLEHAQKWKYAIAVKVKKGDKLFWYVEGWAAE